MPVQQTDDQPQLIHPDEILQWLQKTKMVFDDRGVEGAIKQALFLGAVHL
jgi:hypothetical protein